MCVCAVLVCVLHLKCVHIVVNLSPPSLPLSLPPSLPLSLTHSLTLSLPSLSLFLSPSTYVANRVSDKLTEISQHIYCCRSGSSADTQAIADIVKYQLNIHRSMENIHTLTNAHAHTATHTYKYTCTPPPPPPHTHTLTHMHATIHKPSVWSWMAILLSRPQLSIFASCAMTIVTHSQLASYVPAGTRGMGGRSSPYHWVACV